MTRVAGGAEGAAGAAVELDPVLDADAGAAVALPHAARAVAARDGRGELGALLLPLWQGQSRVGTCVHSTITYVRLFVTTFVRVGQIHPELGSGSLFTSIDEQLQSVEVVIFHENYSCAEVERHVRMIRRNSRSGVFQMMESMAKQGLLDFHRGAMPKTLAL